MRDVDHWDVSNASISNSFGPNMRVSFKAWTDEVAVDAAMLFPEPSPIPSAFDRLIRQLLKCLR